MAGVTLSGKDLIVNLSGSDYPGRIEYTQSRAQADIEALGKAIAIVDTGLRVPELHLEGWAYGENADDTISALQSFSWNNISGMVSIPDREWPTALSDGNKSAPYSVADFRVEEQGGAPKNYHYELLLRRMDVTKLIKTGKISF